MRPSRSAVGVGVVALLAAVVAVVLAHLAGATAQAREDALVAARTRLPDLLSYDRTSLDEDLERALDQTTGAFTADYRRILTDVVEPTAKRRGISTSASVSAAGVVSGDRDEVVVLVFLTQRTTAKGDAASLSGSRVEVTLARAGESWKIAGLKPV